MMTLATFFRIVRPNPPTRRDMLSYAELGIPNLSNDPEVRRLSEGIPVYATLAQARRAARAQPRLGTHVAELRIPDDGQFSFARTGGHQDITPSRMRILTSLLSQYLLVLVEC